MLQPICGYVLDTIGLKLGFAIFATAWSFISMAHALAGSWQALRRPARAARLRRRVRESGRDEGDVGVVSGERARAGRRLLQHRRVGRVDARARRSSPGRSLTYSWQVAFVITGALGLVWVVVWLLASITRRTRIRALSAERARLHRHRPGAHLAGDGAAVDRQRSSVSGTSGASRCRASSRIRHGAR